MNGAHLHLVLTHLPVVGILGVIGMLAVGLWRREEVLQRAGLVVMVLVGLAAGAAYLTGEGAEDVLEGRPGVSEAAIEQHEEVAMIALAGAGVVALFGLWTLVKGRRAALRRGSVAVVLGGAVVVSGLMAYAANLGGQIGHPEIRAAQASEQGPGRVDD